MLNYLAIKTAEAAAFSYPTSTQVSDFGGWLQDGFDRLIVTLGPSGLVLAIIAFILVGVVVGLVFKYVRGIGHAGK